jgi:hypothetical protein
MTLPKGFGSKTGSSGKRSFNEWWGSVPSDLTQRARKGDEQNKPLLNQVNYVLLHLHLAGKHDSKPTYEELKGWIHSGQIDVLRMGQKTITPNVPVKRGEGSFFQTKSIRS